MIPETLTILRPVATIVASADVTVRVVG